MECSTKIWTDSLGFLLNDVSRQLRNRFDRQARALGLTRAQWRVMMFLRRHEGARQSELAALLEVENVTLGRHIDRLEESGWVERRSDPSDRRAWLLYLADKSMPILDKLAVVLIETRETALTGFHARARRSDRNAPAHQSEFSRRGRSRYDCGRTTASRDRSSGLT